MNWQDNLIQTNEQPRIDPIQTHRVLGIKTDTQADQPSVYVPAYMKKPAS
jgi:hypothetical protein